MQKRCLALAMIMTSAAFLTVSHFVEIDHAYAGYVHPPLPDPPGPDDPDETPPPPEPPCRTGLVWTCEAYSYETNVPAGFPDLDDEYTNEPPPGSSESGAGPAVYTESDARTYGSLWTSELIGSMSINAYAQIYTDRGEEEYSATDLVIPGVGIDYKHTRTYRNQETSNRSQGVNWSHNYQERILLVRGNVSHINRPEFFPPYEAFVRAGDFPGDNSRWDRYQGYDLYQGDVLYVPPTGDVKFGMFPPKDNFTRLTFVDPGAPDNADYYVYDTIPTQPLYFSGSFFRNDVRDDKLVLHSRNGWVREYRNQVAVVGGDSMTIPTTWAVLQFYLTKIKDHSGNEISLQYTEITGSVTGKKIVRLDRVIDTLGRVIEYDYITQDSDTDNDGENDSEKFGRLKKITDFMGRTVEYTYDDEGNLTHAKAPAVDDTSVVNNDFTGSQRKTERYEYSDLDGQGNPLTNKRQRHNLIAVYRPNENDSRHGLETSDSEPVLSWSYYLNDRVKTHTIGSGHQSGSDWESGGIFTYRYKGFGESDPDHADRVDYEGSYEDDVRLRTTEVDPRGNRTVYFYNDRARGSLVRREQHITNPETGAAEVLITRKVYRSNGLNVMTKHPDGSLTLREFETRGPSRTHNANMIRQVELPADAVAAGSAPWDIEVAAADQHALDYRYAYDPIYNKRWIEVGPRGNQGLPGVAPFIAPRWYDVNAHSSLDDIQEVLNDLPIDVDAMLPNNVPMFTAPSGGPVDTRRYVTEYVFDYQEAATYATELASRAGLDVNALRELIRHAEAQRERALSELSGNFDFDLYDTDPTSNLLPESRMKLGDQNGDGRTDQFNGKIVKTIYPSVRLHDGSTQSIETESRFDDQGRILVEIDARNTETHYEYGTTPTTIGTGSVFAKINTEYDEGFLKKITVDPTGENLVTVFKRNPLGAVLEATDPRGNVSTTTYNELGQPIRARAYHGAAAGGTLMSESLSIYDANNNVIASYLRDIETNSASVPGDYNTNGGFNSLPLVSAAAAVPGVTTPTADSPAGYFGSRTEYNISDLPIRQHVEATNPVAGSPSLWLTSETRYDANQMPVWTKTPLGFITQTLYDERKLAFQVTSGVGTPDATTTTTFYDKRGQPYRTIDAHHNGGASQSMTLSSLGTVLLSPYESGAGSIPHPLNTSNIIGLAGTPTVPLVVHTGDVTTLVYDGFGRLKKTTDALGNVSLNYYDPAGNIVETAYYGPIGGASPTDNTGTNNKLLSLTRMSFDEANRNYRTDRLIGVADTVSPVRTPVLSDDDTYFTGDASPDGTAYAFPDLVPAEAPSVPNYSLQNYGGWISGLTVFDPAGNVLQSYDDNGDITTTAYDDLSRPTTVTDPFGNVSETFYDPNSNVIQVIHTDKDQTGGPDQIVQAFFAYDALNRKTRAKADPGDGDIIDYYGYDSRSNPTVHFDARGNVSRSFFDAAGRSLASVQDLTVNGTGSTALDLTQGGGDGRILTRSVYDNDSRLIAQIDDNNNRTSYEYDALGRKTKTIFGQYDNADGVAVSAGEATLYGVTAGGNLADQQDTPTEKTWAYDKDSNVTTHVDQNGTTHSFTYDGGHRRTQVDITFAAGTHDLAGTTQQVFEYDGLGRQTYALDNNGAGNDVINRWKYDLLSRTLEESTKIGSFDERFQSWEYNGSLADSGSGTPSAQLYADGRRIKYAYDTNDRLKSITDDLVGASPIVEYQYVGPGNRTASVERANDVDHTFTYDDIRRRTAITDQDTSGGGATTLSGFEYAYDGEHQPRFERNLTQGTESEYYSFDSAGRTRLFLRGPLTPTGGIGGVTSMGGVTQTRYFKLDGVNNWQQTSTTVDNVQSIEDRDHTNFNEIHTAPDTTGVTADLTYDDQGNLLRRDYPTGSGRRSVTYHWDGLNRLREVRLAAAPQTVLVEYLHATGNQRVAKTVSDGGVPSDSSLNGTRHFYYAGWKLCDEHEITISGRGGVTDGLRFQYVWGPRHDDELVVRDDRLDAGLAELNDGAPGGTTTASGGRQYQHHNRGWNIRAVTDEAGGVLERYLYDPHGKPTVLNAAGNTVLASTAIGQDYGYTSQRYDRETELWYFKHRYLDDGLGRFISRDPAGYVDGMNLYTAYFVLTGTDPLGLGAKRIIDAHKDAVRKMNKDFAGDRITPERLAAERPKSKKYLTDEVKKEYPRGVQYTDDGFADFTEYSKKTVKPEGLNGSSYDADRANKAAGFDETPEGMVWHHHHDAESMMLVDENLHNAYRHTGGAAVLTKMRTGGGLIVPTAVVTISAAVANGGELTAEQKNFVEAGRDYAESIARKSEMGMEDAAVRMWTSLGELGVDGGQGTIAAGFMMTAGRYEIAEIKKKEREAAEQAKEEGK